MTDFTLGVNYWPRKKAMYWWNDFDAGEVKEEFAVIKDIGMNVVRLFLLWDDFQPEPNMVAKDKLDNLVQVADIADEAGLGERELELHVEEGRTAAATASSKAFTASRKRLSR